MSNIFDEIHASSADHEQAAKRQAEHIRESVRLLMARREGRAFLRWLGEGQNALTILNLIMDHEEGNYVR